MYATKEQDHEKRAKQEGSYSTYNYLYNYLLNNYEPENLESSYAASACEKLLLKEGKAYCSKIGKIPSDTEMLALARDAICNFIKNDGKHGDTAKNFGKQHKNSLNTIKKTISELRW